MIVFSFIVKKTIIKSVKTILMLIKKKVDVMFINEFQIDILIINEFQNILEQQT